MPATVVLVHGSLSGSWAWQDVIDDLDGHGVAGVAVDLPSHSLSDPGIDFRDDARHVRQVIDGIDGPVVLLGNSYGGLVITEAANDHASVRRLVFLAAVMLGPGQSLMDGLRGNSPELGAALRFRDDGMIEADIDALVRFGMQQAPEHAKDLVRANASRPMSLGVDPTAALTVAAWQQIPSTYVVCTDDLSVDPAFQREMAIQATDVLEVPWDHWPQHSHPAELADLLATVAHGVGTTR